MLRVEIAETRKTLYRVLVEAVQRQYGEVYEVETFLKSWENFTVLYSYKNVHT